ncbi:aldose epimerase family protein [Parapedobacter sp. DT-150]|uniref:aldose epimerase family protein n=1 Tax=Parapedobacter sp. DT-150 TaxID=3396162 RepID=UPI003F1B6382
MNRSTIYSTLCIAGAAALMSCGAPQSMQDLTKSGLDRQRFQTVVNGDSTDLFVLSNSNGMEVCLTNYGGRIVSLMVPDAGGHLRDVVLGFDHIGEYTAQPSSFGATVGRYANRIDSGRFMLEDDTIQLDINSGVHSIHGGREGWQYQVFDAQQPNDSTLVLSYVSPDGEGGFPGEVSVSVSYTVTSLNELMIGYEVQTTAKTVVNVTNHSFFNLSGDPSTTVLDDVLYVNASQYTPLDSTLITTGALMPVAGTPFDFTEPISIGEAMARDSAHTQLQIASGIDHNFVLDTRGDTRELAARLYSPQSGIALEVYTNEPGMQVYTGNMLDGSRIGKNKQPYHKQTAVCLETQHFPDSPNKPHWPSTVLEPGAPYMSQCIYRFTAESDNR